MLLVEVVAFRDLKVRFRFKIRAVRYSRNCFSDLVWCGLHCNVVDVSGLVVERAVRVLDSVSEVMVWCGCCIVADVSGVVERTVQKRGRIIYRRCARVLPSVVHLEIHVAAPVYLILLTLRLPGTGAD